MKNLKNTTQVADQSNKKSVISQKHAVNLQKNSTLYFQIGLIICLLATYGIFEMRFENKNYDVAWVNPIDESDLYMVNKYTIYQEPAQPKEIQNPVVKLTDLPPKEVPNNTSFTPTITAPDVPTVDMPVKVNPNPPITPPIDNSTFSMIDVERVPVYPGCESAKTNAERIQCMSDKLSSLIQKKFNTDLAVDLGLSGTQRIFVAFKIDKNGNVSDVQARAPHNQLEKEAIRLTTKIPQMTPGKQREKPVDVLYNLPIIFKVQ